MNFSKNVSISPKILNQAIKDYKERKKILRNIEREFELRYFERYTMFLLNNSIKDIYKMIEERDMYDTYLEI